MAIQQGERVKKLVVNVPHGMFEGDVTCKIVVGYGL